MAILKDGAKRRKVFHTFQIISGRYDQGNERISLGQHRRWKRSLVRAVEEHVTPGAHILDLCCGTGDVSLFLAESGSGFQITGVDFSPNMLKAAARKLRGKENVNLIRADAMKLPFPDNTFDCAVISFGLRNTPDYLRVLKEMVRVVKPSGMAACLEASYPETPLVRPFFWLYFKYLMPLAGGGFKNFREYQWLYESTEAFVSKGGLLRLFNRAGLTDRKYTSFMFGACACHIGYKKRRNTGVYSGTAGQHG